MTLISATPSSLSIWRCIFAISLLSSFLFTSSPSTRNPHDDGSSPLAAVSFLTSVSANQTCLPSNCPLLDTQGVIEYPCITTDNYHITMGRPTYLSYNCSDDQAAYIIDFQLQTFPTRNDKLTVTMGAGYSPAQGLQTYDLTDEYSRIHNEFSTTGHSCIGLVGSKIGGQSSSIYIAINCVQSTNAGQECNPYYSFSFTCEDPLKPILTRNGIIIVTVTVGGVVFAVLLLLLYTGTLRKCFCSSKSCPACCRYVPPPPTANQVSDISMTTTTPAGGKQALEVTPMGPSSKVVQPPPPTVIHFSPEYYNTPLEERLRRAEEGDHAYYIQTPR